MTQGLATPMGAKHTCVLAEHLEERLVGRNEAGSERPDLVTDQVGAKSPRLVTDQAQAGQGDLSTVQAPEPPGRLSTAQPQENPESLSTPQAEFLDKLSATQETVIAFCDTPRRLSAIMDTLGMTSRGYFKIRHLDPLLQGGVLRMTHPEQPNHPDQAYVRAHEPPERLSTAQPSKTLERLSTAQPLKNPESVSTAQPRKKPESVSSTAQAGLLTDLSAIQEQVIALCDTPQHLTGLMEALGVTGRGYFKMRQIDPLLRGGILRMTHPEQPNHPDQAYVLTEAGVALKAHQASRNDVGAGSGDGDEQ